jgi:hypothetical protein
LCVLPAAAKDFLACWRSAHCCPVGLYICPLPLPSPSCVNGLCFRGHRTCLDSKLRGRKHATSEGALVPEVGPKMFGVSHPNEATPWRRNSAKTHPHRPQTEWSPPNLLYKPPPATTPATPTSSTPPAGPVMHPPWRRNSAKVRRSLGVFVWGGSGGTLVGVRKNTESLKTQEQAKHAKHRAPPMAGLLRVLRYCVCSRC